MGKRFTPSGIKKSLLAAFAALTGALNFVGLLLIWMDINIYVDMHVMLAPVLYNHFSFIAGVELIAIKGLLLLALVKSFIFLIFLTC